METGKKLTTLTPDLFEPAPKADDAAERIGGEPIGFWKDAWGRLKKTRPP